MRTPNGPKAAYRRVELAERFSDPAFIASFEPGTVGAAYRSFLESTGYSATGLADISNFDREPLIEHPYAWMGRRTRDVHDIWHALTGYKADETLGEASLVAFSYAQTGGLGWAFIAFASALKSLSVTRNTAFVRSVIEGWRNGRKATWLLGEDYEALLHEPLDAAHASGWALPSRWLTGRRSNGLPSSLASKRRRRPCRTVPIALQAGRGLGKDALPQQRHCVASRSNFRSLAS